MTGQGELGHGVLEVWRDGVLGEIGAARGEGGRGSGRCGQDDENGSKAIFILNSIVRLIWRDRHAIFTSRINGHSYQVADGGHGRVVAGLYHGGEQVIGVRHG